MIHLTSVLYTLVWQIVPIWDDFRERRTAPERVQAVVIMPASAPEPRTKPEPNNERTTRKPALGCFNSRGTVETKRVRDPHRTESEQREKRREVLPIGTTSNTSKQERTKRNITNELRTNSEKTPSKPRESREKAVRNEQFFRTFSAKKDHCRKWWSELYQNPEPLPWLDFGSLVLRRRSLILCSQLHKAANGCPSIRARALFYS